jgi:DNA invertase Pin-like site-specific DNA recombinase
MTIASEKVTTRHLARLAYLYVRQSTVRQVFENTESTTRQYALRERAVALGWPTERIVVVDSDLGHSAASAVDRAGFQTLVAEVGLGHVGIVLGLEVSRLARNNSDWHRLLEICALTQTLILDEDGLYDPGHFNDRLLLGLKGTMSEAELHVLQARLRGGILSKAGRGELRLPLPVGFCYAAGDRVVLDPDLQVQQAVRLFFATFARTGSAWGTVKVFREQGLSFPRRIRTGARRGELLWAPLLHSTTLHLLHNPRYAGAFFFGRTRTRKLADGHAQSIVLPQDQWHTLVREAHPGYISWAEFEENQRRLRENAQVCGQERRHGPAREGPALLQGIILCGRCGERMTVRYHHRRSRLVPEYVCQRDGIEHGGPLCQIVPGGRLDQAIGALLVAAVTPLTLEVALTVQAEIASHLEETDRLRLLQVERARYEADLAERRFRQVDPENRLVAAVLEAEWNEHLRLLAEAQRTYDQQRQTDRQRLDEQQRAAILALSTDFPRLWNDPHTPDRERKRMVRLLLADVTVCKEEQIIAHIRFAGGATRTLLVPLGRPAEEIRRTDPAIVAQIDQLLDHYTDGTVATLLNERGLRSFEGKPFDGSRIAGLRHRYHLQDRFGRLRAAGMLTRLEIATALGICPATVHEWRRVGLLRAHPYNDQGACLYEPLGACPPLKYTARYAARRTLRETQKAGAV